MTNKTDQVLYAELLVFTDKAKQLHVKIQTNVQVVYTEHVSATQHVSLNQTAVYTGQVTSCASRSVQYHTSKGKGQVIVAGN